MEYDAYVHLFQFGIVDTKVEVIVAGTPHSGGCCYHYADKYALYSHVVMIYEMLVHRGFHLGMVWDRERALLVCHLP